MNLQRRKNKRGIAFLGEHTVKIVIAAICILFLVILAVKLYYSVKSDSDLEKAKKSMDILEGQITSLLSTKSIETQPVMLFPPKEWFLNSYGYGRIYPRPKGECAWSYACLCMCKEESCEGLRVCKGFSKEVRTAAKDGLPITMFREVIELELIYAKDKYSGNDKILIQWPPEIASSGCNNGEVRNANKVCECDAAAGWTSFSNPWRSQEPPCQWDKSEDRKVLDKSLEVTETNKNDEGVCIHYYTIRFYSALASDKTNQDLYNELSTYPHSNGYVQKVDKLAMDSNIDNFGSHVMTRENCAKMGVMTSYNIFYTSFDSGNNVYQLTGKIDDLGYCVKFPVDSSKNDIIADNELVKRDKCIMIADAEKGFYTVSFFVETTGKIMYNPPAQPNPTKEQKINLHFSSDFEATKTETVTGEYVKEKCSSWDQYDLTFITGTLMADGTSGNLNKACLNELKAIGFDTQYRRSYLERVNDNVCCSYNKI